MIFTKSKPKINHFMYMDGIMIFAKNEKEQETLLQTVRIYSQDIGMEFAVGKCALVIRKNGKRETGEEIEWPNQESMRMLGEKENFWYLRILEVDTK